MLPASVTLECPSSAFWPVYLTDFCEAGITKDLHPVLAEHAVGFPASVCPFWTHSSVDEARAFSLPSGSLATSGAIPREG